MRILVIGGKRLIGKHLVENLLKDGHKVIIATRGLTDDNWCNDVERIIIERTSEESIYNQLHGKHYDIVYDSLAYCSNDVKYLIDVIKCDKYIMTSSVSVYQELKEDMKESDFDPTIYSLKWCQRTDYSYNEIKRQAECALYQIYNHIPSVAVRFPFVVGEDDYTNRLKFYIEHVVNSIPMFIDNLDERMSFITSDEAGKFLAHFTTHDFDGIINANSRGMISIREVIQYTEEKTGNKAIFSDKTDNAPYNGTKTYSMDLSKSESIGFEFSTIDSRFYGLLDRLILSSLKC